MKTRDQSGLWFWENCLLDDLSLMLAVHTFVSRKRPVDPIMKANIIKCGGRLHNGPPDSSTMHVVLFFNS